METMTKGVRAHRSEFVDWAALAHRLGLTFNGWARRAMQEQAALDRALLREAGDGASDAV